MLSYNLPNIISSIDQLEPPEGPLDMNGNQINEVGTPTSPDDAANKDYIDDGLVTKSDTTHNHLLNSLIDPNGSVDLNGQNIIDLKDPVGDKDAVTKIYVDARAAGLQIKQECVVTSISDITNLDYRTTQINGYTYTDGERLLIRNQGDAKQNGIYIGSTTDVWTRALDMNTSEEIARAYTLITGGDTLAYSSWVVEGAPELGVDDIIFVKFSQSGSIEAGDGIDKEGNTISVIGTTNRILVDENGVNISPNYSGQNTITTVGDIAQGTWSGTTIELHHGGTGATTKNDACKSLGVVFNTITDVSENQIVAGADRGKMLNTNATSGTITHTLPLAATHGNGFIVSFRKSDSSVNSVTVQRAGSDTINGSTTATLTYQNQTMTLISDGVTGWVIAQRGQRNPTPIGEGGTGVDLSATGGTGKFVKQVTTGANLTVDTIAASELPSAIDASKLANGTVSNTELQYINSLSSNAQTQLNAKIEASNALLSTQNVLMVKKNPGTGEYLTIAAAISAINALGDASDTNRYVIHVGPGVYSEALLTVPSYVSVLGEIQSSIVVEPNGDHNVFNLSNQTMLENMIIQNAPSGRCGVYSNDVGDFALMHKCSLYDCDIGVWQRSNAADSYLFLEYVDFLDCGTNSAKVTCAASKTSFLNCENLFVQYNSVNPADAFLIDGAYAKCNISGCQMMGADVLGNAFRVTNGGYLNVATGRIEDWGQSFYVDSSGSNPYLKAQAIDLDDNTEDINVDNATCTGFFMGAVDFSKVYIDSDAPFFIANQDSQIVTVSKKGGNFTSIKDAVESIDDSSTTKRYVVFVGPGTFSERTIVMRPYVYIAGTTGKLATIIEQNAADTYLIQSNVNCAIINCFLRGVTGSGKATVRYTGDRFRLIDTRFGTAQTCIDAQTVSGTTGNSLWVTRGSLANGISIVDFIKVSDDGSHVIDVFMEGLNFLDAIAMTNFATISGEYTKVYVMNCLARMSSNDATGYGISLSNGADLRMFSSAIGRYATALTIPNNGVAPNITISACVFRLNTVADMNIAHVGVTGTISVMCDREKVTVNDTCTVGIQIFDTDDGSTTFVGDFYLGSKFSNTQNYTSAIQQSQPTGVISGGVLSVSSGLIAAISSGDGYLMAGSAPNDYGKYITWGNLTTTLPANIDSFIYIDSNGAAQNAPSRPNTLTTILIGKARTSASSILFFQDVESDAKNTDSKLDRTLRFGLGPIYSTGSIVTEYSTPLHLVVESGLYYYGTHEYEPSGGSNITWTSWRRNGSGGWVTGSQNAVDNAYYDNNLANLAAIPGTNYAKHSLYIVNDGVNESYHLVYAQTTNADLTTIQNGAISTPPGTWSSNIVRIATIIVRAGTSTIVEIRDERPRLGFVASATSVVTVHDELTGRDTDGHSQYLLANGYRAMSGDLDMNTNDIVDVGTINSIDIASHGTRHDPNSGTDAVTTAAPSTALSVSTTNTEGSAASLARSDHIHAITTQTANHANTIVARDGAGNFSAGVITSNLTGLVTGDVTGNVSGSAGSFTGSLVGDITGTQGATVVSTVGTSSAAKVHAAELLANAATDANTASAIVKRTAGGNFSAGTITANITGNVSGTAANVTGTVAIANGGTGATEASAALTALGGITSARTISTTAPLTGGGDLTTNRTFAISAATSGAAGSMSSADKTKLDTYLGVKTVAQLGTATAGLTAWCSNALWSGGTGCWVFADGTNWRTTEAVVATTDTYVFDRDTSGFPISTDLYNSFSEDFVGPLSQYSYFLSATQNGGTVSNIAVIDNGHPGIMSLNTGTTNNVTGGALLYAGERSGTTALSWRLGGGRLYFGVIIYLPVLAAANPDYIVRLGFRSNSNFAEAINGVYFEYNRGVNTNWLIKTADNNSITSVDTGIAVVATTWIKLECEINAAGNSASFYHNGTLINVVGNPIVANIPVTAGREVQPILEIKKTGTPNTATSRSLYIDLFRTKQTLTTSR